VLWEPQVHIGRRLWHCSTCASELIHHPADLRRKCEHCGLSFSKFGKASGQLDSPGMYRRQAELHLNAVRVTQELEAQNWTQEIARVEREVSQREHLIWLGNHLLYLQTDPAEARRYFNLDRRK